MALAETRRELEEQLEEAGLSAFSYLPERIQPPVVLISAGTPYLDKGPTYCDFIVNLTATLVAAKATNTIETDEIDRMIETVILGTESSFGIDRVEAPFSLEVNNAAYLAVKILVSKEIDL